MNTAIMLAASAAAAFGAAFAPSAIASNVSTDGYVYLTADDLGGSFSFASDNGRWSEAGVPSPGHDYLVQAASGNPRRLRVNSTTTFGGDSLTLDNGAIFAQCDGTFTIGNLIVYDGTFRATTGDAVPCLNGAVELRNSANFKIEGTAGRIAEVSANVSGTGIIYVATPEDTNAGVQPLPFWTVKLSGNNSAFSGRIIVQSLSTGRGWPSALIATSLSALGSGDSDGNNAVELMGRCALFGQGLNFTNPSHSIKTGGNPRFGSYENCSGGYGLRLDGGVSIASTASGTALYITNVVGTTILGNVSLAGFAKVVVQSGTVRFASGWNRPSLPIEVAAGATVSCEEGAVLGPLSGIDGAVVTVALPEIDVTATNRTNAGFAIPVLSAQSLDLADLHPYGGVTREYFSVEDNGSGGKTLWWRRDDDNSHGVVYMATTGDQFSFGPTTGYPTSQNPWRWSSGSAPAPGIDYIVENGKIVRCRATNTFAGNSLAILSGGDLSIYDFTATVGTLRLMEESRSIVRGSSVGTLAGSATVRTSATGFANVEIENGQMTLAASLSGDGNIRYRALNSDMSKTGTILVTGDNRAFTGKVKIENPKITVKFAGESAIGGKPARFTADGFSVADGVTLRSDSGYPLCVTNSNRGVALLGATTVDVASGATASLTSPISGSGSLAKTGAGTLRLGNDANSFSGGIALDAGIIDAVSAGTFGASQLEYSGGTLKISCEDPLTIKGATPIALASGAGPAQILPAPGGSKWDGGKVGLFLFPDVSGLTPEAVAALVAIADTDLSIVEWTVENTASGTLVLAQKQSPTMILMR